MFKKGDFVLGWVLVRVQWLWGKHENVSREEGMSLLNFQKKSVGQEKHRNNVVSKR